MILFVFLLEKAKYISQRMFRYGTFRVLDNIGKLLFTNKGGVDQLK